MIRQFDVFANLSRSGRADRPFIIVVQSGFLEHLQTRVCAPLVITDALQPVARLHPMLHVQHQTLYFSPTELVTIPTRILRQPVANLKHERDKLIAALDLVFTGI